MKPFHKFLIILLIVITIPTVAISLLPKKPTTPPSTTLPPSKFNPDLPVTFPTINPNTVYTQPTSFILKIADSQLSQIPKSAVILRLTPPHDWAPSLAKKIGFSVDPQPIGNALFWNESPQKLAINLVSLSGNLTTSLPPVPWTKEDMEKHARNLISQFLPIPSDQPGRIYPFLLQDEVEAQLTTIETSNYVKISYFPSHKGLPVIANSSSIGPITATFNKPARVFQIDFIYTQTEEVKSLQLKTPSQAIDDLKQHKGTIIDLSLPTNLGQATQNPITPKVATINTVKIGYYLPQDRKDILLPVYIFEGFATTELGKAANILILLPATSP